MWWRNQKQRESKSEGRENFINNSISKDTRASRDDDSSEQMKKFEERISDKSLSVKNVFVQVLSGIS